MFLYSFRFYLHYFLRLLLNNLNPIKTKKLPAYFLILLSITISSTAFSYQALTDNKPNTASENSTFIESNDNLLKFSQLTILDGLSNSNVFGVTQDNQGFIWFATEDGLNRFDGKNIVIYRHNANNKFSIADNLIRKVFYDSENTLWVGTQNGLSRYNRELDNFDNFYSVTGDENSLRDNVIWDIYQNKTGLEQNDQARPLLWISTTDGLHTLAVDSNINDTLFQRIKIRKYNDRIREIKTIFQDKKQNYWLGTFDKGIHLLSKNLTYNGSLSGQNKYDLTIDAKTLFDINNVDNQYWLATDNGLFIIDDRYQLVSHLTADDTKKSSKERLLSNNIEAIKQFDENHVWLATRDGLNTINLLNDQIESYQNNAQPSSLSENWLTDIFLDSNGSMWLASYGGGLNKHSPLTSFFHHSLTTNKSEKFRVESFAETPDGTIWLSTEKRGLFKRTKNKIIQEQLNIEENIWQVLSDKNGVLWLRTESGKLFKYDSIYKKLLEHKKWQKNSKTNSYKLALMNENDIWYINQKNTLTKYNTTNQKFTSYPTKTKANFINFQIDKNKNIWLITKDQKIVTFNITNKTFQPFSIKLLEEIKNGSINNIAISNNYLWLNSNSQRVILIDKKLKTSSILSKNTTSKINQISSVLIDQKDRAWIAKNTGIDKITPENKSAIHFDSEFIESSPEFIENSSFKSSKGELFFGSPNGFYSFYPEELLQVKQSISQPVFTNLYVANKKILIKANQNKTSTSNTYTLAKQLNYLEQVKLAYMQSPISFEFISPNTKLPTQLRYKYRLLNLEKSWIDAVTETGGYSNRATYTNLSPGDYIFEVQAYDINQPNNSKISQLNVQILPPWWLSTSMLFVYTLISLLILIYVMQQYRNKKTYNAQIKESEERLKLSLWGSGDEMWDWNITTGKIYRSNIWGILEFPQDGTRNSSAEKNIQGKEQTNVHHHDIERVKTALNDHFTNETEHFEVTYRVKDKNNNWIWILDRGKIVDRDEDNNATRMTGTLKDISQIKKAEERLKLFARCIQNISDAVVIYDRQFITVDVNKAFQRITGKSKKAMVGCSLSFNQYPLRFSQDIKKHLLTKGSWHGEIENLRSDGTKYLTDLNIDVIHDESGNISHFVGVFSDITTRKETEAELIKLASSDTLTGLPNRAFFQANQARLVKKNINHALLVFDLDNFKKINDSMGHQLGDDILCQVAKRMLTLSRKKDTVYRLGGDEFSIIIEDTNDIHTITSLAKEILRTIALPFKVKNQEIVLYSSIGIVLFPEDGLTGHELLKNADTAMYHAKNSGGNKYQFFSDSMNKKAVKRLQIENLIRHGLKEDSFSVYYQPKIEISTGKIAGMEALVRFETPNKGVVSPVVFIPVSEETGQIIDIGEVVLRKACFATKKWVDAGLFDGRVAVNLSAVQFTQANLVAQIAGILKESQLPAKYLELEITEGTVMDSPQAAIDTMLQIRAMGIHLSLDDFGTGYSSLAYLKKFPLNTLKIDKAFVDDIEQSEQGRNMVATIVTIAHNLGMDVVAEGVETNQQLSFLAGLHCEQLQGYLYSKPLATDNFQNYLLAHQITSKSTSFNR